MATRLTRRRLLRSSLVLGAGLGMNLPGLVNGQGETPVPEATEGEAPVSLELDGTIRRVHDPAIIKEGDTYYLFSTGAGIPVRKSTDLVNWEFAFPATVFRGIPDWAREMIPNQNDFWAPDISYYNDKFHLYYSVSTFGVNRSVIGLATNATLDSQADNFEWVDHGLVVESVRGNDYNCIDANLILDGDGIPWLAFGSHWSGIKMRRLDYETGMLSSEDTALYSLASRRLHPRAVEAPFIIRKDDLYYMFVSFDACCQGADSTYNVRVGRAASITGPYVDREGVDMMNDGGTQVTFPTERWRGPGHNSILQENGVDYIVYHAYDADNQGVFTLRIDPLIWDADGWPETVTP